MNEGQSRALAEHRLTQANERLDSARLLFENGKYADSINRTYYAVFTAARAMLALKRLDSRKHSGVISLFNQHFVKEGMIGKEAGNIIITARHFREDADYADYVEITKEMAANELEKAEGLLAEIEARVRDWKERP